MLRPVERAQWPMRGAPAASSEAGVVIQSGVAGGGAAPKAGGHGVLLMSELVICGEGMRLAA